MPAGDATAPVLDGGCHCGALRYRLSGAAIDSGYCHCRTCQRTTGAPVLAWTTVPAEAFALLKGRPRVYRSSAWGERHFCGTCGAQILYRDSDGARTVDINIGTLDEPARVAPEYHVHRASRIPWFETADDLPRHDDHGPDGPPPG